MSMYLPAQLPICPQKDSWTGRNQLDQLSLTSIGVRLCILQLKNRVHAGVGVVAHVSKALIGSSRVGLSHGDHPLDPNLT